jgi:tetratricopeptide (TPR) repeat protein
MKSLIMLTACFLAILFFHETSCAGNKGLVITPDLQFEYAQTLFNDQDYETAMVEFKRFAHFFPDHDRTDQAEFNIGVCLFNLKKFHDAARAFNKIILKAQENPMTEQAFFFQSRAFLNLENFGYAQIVLQNFLKLTEDPETKDRIYFNLAQIRLAEVRKGKDASLVPARQYLLKISAAGAVKYSVDQHLAMILRAEHMPKKNPTAAGLFAVIPGGGFLYCERYHDALITFLLNTGLMVAACEAFNNDNTALAGVIAFVETGFYAGNIYGSISSAHKYNRAQTIQILNREFSITSRLDPENNGYEFSLNYPF